MCSLEQQRLRFSETPSNQFHPFAAQKKFVSCSWLVQICLQEHGTPNKLPNSSNLHHMLGKRPFAYAVRSLRIRTLLIHQVLNHLEMFPSTQPYAMLSGPFCLQSFHIGAPALHQTLYSRKICSCMHAIAMALSVVIHSSCICFPNNHDAL
jgi:hypothetical protein